MTLPQQVLSDGFLRLALQYRRAYYNLSVTQPLSWPRYFLFCHSIELLLKGYLVATVGLTQQQLKDKYGHDLGELLTEAVKLGLPLDPAAKDELTILTDAHTKFWPRYPMETAVPVAIIDRQQFEPDARELFSLVFSKLGYGRLH